MTPDPRLIPGLDPEPTDEEVSESLVWSPRTPEIVGYSLLACTFAAHRVAAARQAIEWTAKTFCKSCSADWPIEYSISDNVWYHEIQGASEEGAGSAICHATPLWIALTAHDAAMGRETDG